ncbi:hypothetical protein MXB_2256 [Myxobolus squamalis]|nr:hypothetical protein MXB_2256 [Myxobolus squamalis]
MHCSKGAAETRKVASMNMEDSICKTAEPSFDAQIAILLYLPPNSPYTVTLEKRKAFTAGGKRRVFDVLYRHVVST